MGPSVVDQVRPALAAAMSDPDPEVGRACGAAILKLQGQPVPGTEPETEEKRP